MKTRLVYLFVLAFGPFARADSSTKDVETRSLTPSKPQHVFRVVVDSIPSGASVYKLASDGTLGEKLTETPWTVVIPMIELSYQDAASGKNVHKGWRIGNRGLVNGRTGKDGLHLALNVCLYKEGYAPERMSSRDVCVLKAVKGWTWPENKTLTVQLQTVEAARASELLGAQAQEDRIQRQQWQRQNEQAQADRDVPKPRANTMRRLKPITRLWRISTKRR